MFQGFDPHGRRWRAFWVGMGLLALLAPRAAAQAEAPGREDDLTGLSLEELMQVEVVSVSKHAEPVFETPAAVFVLTAEDLRRSGSRSVAEALRMVPGLDVAQVDATKWAISARSFNSRFANKLLVMIDGRSIYSPLFSGVWWEMQNLPLHEVERIEVIRGPGGTLWGVNAVNGVINIITKAPGDAGGKVAAGAGTDGRVFAEAGVSGTLPGAGKYRLWGTAGRQDELASPVGNVEGDDWRHLGAGLRAEWPLAGGSLSLFSGFHSSGIRDHLLNPLLEPPYQEEVATRVELSDVYSQARWRRRLANDGAVTLQVYADRERRDQFLIESRIDTIDVDFQAETSGARRHRLVGGLGLRFIDDDLVGSWSVSFRPRRESRWIWSGFVQDEIALPGNRATVTFGSKLEYSDLAGLEAQPSLRLGGRLGDRQFLWASFSRAVRTPSRAERDVTVWLATVPSGSGLPVQVRVKGNHDLDVEELLAYEAGYRLQASGTLDFDAVVFDHRYDNLFASSEGVPRFAASPPRIVLDLPITTLFSARTYGVELTGRWISRPGWAWSASYWFLRFASLDLDSSPEQRLRPDGSPRHQARLSSRLDLPRGGEMDVALHYADAIPGLSLPSHLALDARLAWRLPSGGEIALAGRDLFAGRHLETGVTEEGAVPSAIGPSGYVSFAWTW